MEAESGRGVTHRLYSTGNGISEGQPWVATAWFVLVNVDCVAKRRTGKARGIKTRLFLANSITSVHFFENIV